MQSIENLSGHLEALSFGELEDLIKHYPWFSLARREYFLRMCRLGSECYEEGIGKAAFYLSSRSGMYRELHREKEIQETPPFPLSDALDLTGPANLPEDREGRRIPETGSGASPRVIVVGGDYFSPRDFEELKETRPRWTAGRPDPENNRPAAAPAPEEMPGTGTPADEAFSDEAFYTETLGKIYAEQGFSQRALEVYEKLILLYPEKNAYFAALIEEIKKHL